jgi:hypothetical protein
MKSRDRHIIDLGFSHVEARLQARSFRKYFVTSWKHFSVLAHKIRSEPQLKSLAPFGFAHNSFEHSHLHIAVLVHCLAKATALEG